MHLHQQTIDDLINAIYPGIRNKPVCRDYFSKRAILAPRNDQVDKINSTVFEMMPAESVEYLRADRVDDDEGANTITPEFLNNLDVSGWPPHKLKLKVGAPVMLLRNLNPAKGLCNGTRLLIRYCSTRVLEAEVMTGDHAGHITFIPRISLITETSGIPFPIRRRQFQIRVAYTMTINKSQGQTLTRVGISRRHGQLYVAFSLPKVFI